jgi:hypothetical protein
VASPLAKKTHPKGPCQNTECYRPFCQGYQLGYKEGYNQGFIDGMASCPGPHNG